MLKKFFDVEYEAYCQLQKVFRKINLLIYYNFIRIIYINVNAFKRYNFNIVIYYLKLEINSNNFKHNEIELILFFSRMFIVVKKWYWFIELKIIELIWIIRRVRYIIKVFQHVTVIFIDYIVNASIIKQTTLLFNNIDKLNLRLMRTLVYLFQFRFNIRYQFNKRYVISDALFRLLTNKFFLNSENNLNLKSYHSNIKNSFVSDRHFVYYSSLINILSNFRKQLIDNYIKKKT